MTEFLSSAKQNAILILYSLCVAVAAQLAPIVPLMVTVGGLILVDTLFGVWAAKKRGDALSSNGLSRLLTKMCVYQIVVVTLFFFEKHITGDVLPVMKIAASMMSVVEVISILENAGIIIEKPVFRYLIEKLSSKSKKFDGK
ncbi:hypothetical protein Bb109J_c1945 [Bdellovibrio bacteriovorus]|uniref:phage holin family protein n=1 Tax=Bdellovibrio bacteriovorus TaxID=959 RepID=UPI00045BE7A3|nr:phage holin family protein [Bdellovibrio bacteriovorus]AHZ84635.1 hypothetical protein EP01_06750 [Bdellovibrio bacteriovorus]BEV68525.1 hypothetical protein Bb109J_c1945 [Bdellovibrio bacteriovorus]